MFSREYPLWAMQLVVDQISGGVESFATVGAEVSDT